MSISLIPQVLDEETSTLERFALTSRLVWPATYWDLQHNDSEGGQALYTSQLIDLACYCIRQLKQQAGCPQQKLAYSFSN